MADRAGQQLGNYQLIRLLGEGGFAEVYLGEHLYLKSYAAVKVLHASLSEKQREDFLTEAQRLMSLRHPHIVRILDFAVEGDVPFFVMEYAPHGTLRTLHPKGSRLQLETVIPYVKQVADALQYIHEQKLVHRDVKPENMLLAANQDILLSDLGIAALAYTTGSIIAQGLAGTIPYMAPEQIMELPRPASDQYSLGVVVYEWLCGTRPFQGTELRIAYQHLSTPPPALREHIPTIASAVEQVVLKALAKEPQQRFAHVAAFASALEQAWQAAKRDALSPPTVTAPLNMNASATQLFDSTYMASQPNVAPQSWAPNVPPSQSLSPERRKLSSSQSSRPATVPPASYPPRETRRTPLSPPRRSRSARRRDIIVAILALLTLLSLIFLGYFAVTLSGSTHTPSGTTSDDTRTAGAHNPPTQQPTPTPTPIRWLLLRSLLPLQHKPRVVLPPELSRRLQQASLSIRMP